MQTLQTHTSLLRSLALGCGQDAVMNAATDANAAAGAANEAAVAANNAADTATAAANNAM